MKVKLPGDGDKPTEIALVQSYKNVNVSGHARHAVEHAGESAADDKIHTILRQQNNGVSVFTKWVS